jgi:hypothetical protein
MKIRESSKSTIYLFIKGQTGWQRTTSGPHIIVAGGITMMEGLITGNLVEEYKLGNTTIKIYDNAYIDKTKEDMERIMRRVAEIAMKAN